jgi:hypothetical protein
MKKYYSEEAWERHRRNYEEGPSPEWRDFYRDALSSLEEDPGSEKAQALVERWFELSRPAYYGDPEVQTDSPAAWMDRANWPVAMKERAAEFHMEEVSLFIKQAALAQRKKYFSENAWAKLMKLLQRTEDHSAQWQARVDLFREIEAALGEDPASEKAQALAARWQAQMEEASGGDPEIKLGLLAGWSRRREWPTSLRWQVEGLHTMSFERFEKCADFLDRAVAAAKSKKVDMSKATPKAMRVEEFEEEMAATRKVLECVPEDSSRGSRIQNRPPWKSWPITLQ